MEASSKPIVKKLGIKPGNRIAILYPPRGYTAISGKLPTNVILTTRIAGDAFDLIQAFYEDEKSLKLDLKKFKAAILPNGKIWICWRKGNVTELSRDSIMEIG